MNFCIARSNSAELGTCIARFGLSECITMDRENVIYCCIDSTLLESTNTCTNTST